MKKIIVLAAGVLLSTLTFANRTYESTAASSVAVLSSGSNLVKVFYTSVKPTTVKISIRNENDKVIFSETLKKIDGFIRPYDFGNLPQGQYSVEVEDENGKRIEKINYGPKNVAKIVNIMEVPAEDGKYLLTGSSAGADKINIRIFDLEGKMVYEESRKVNGKFTQVYNLKSLKGAFSIEVSDSQGLLKDFAH